MTWYISTSKLLGRSFGALLKSMVRYFVAIISALLTFALVQLLIIAVVELAHVMPHSGVSAGADIYHLFVAFLDWAACIASVTVGVVLAPGRKLSVAVALSLAVALWHLGKYWSLFRLPRLSAQASCRFLSFTMAA
jgi:hypothetical protein